MTVVWQVSELVSWRQDYSVTSVLNWSSTAMSAMCVGISGPGDDAGESDRVRAGWQPVQLHVDQQSDEQRLQQCLQLAPASASASSSNWRR